MKKPLTARAELLVLKTLYQMNEKGHDANAALDCSTVNNWIDVYVPKDKDIPNMKREYMTSVDAPMTQDEKARADAVREGVVRKFKRVA